MNKTETAQQRKARIIHSLSFASNSAFGVVFPNEDTYGESHRKLQTFVKKVSNEVLSNSNTQKYIGDDWETVWGPVVYSHDQNSSYAVADNTMGVYYSKTKKLFVIAIAGTNSISSFGWMKEDFHVNKTAVWKDISGKGMGDISQGTATGLDVLAHKMQDGNADLLSTLHKFILDKEITSAEVAVTGHSLGGALSPALALYLSDKKKEWCGNATIQMSTYPTAGPTIGIYPTKNKFKETNNFIKYYNDQINNGNIIYESVINDLDIVPLAWNKDDIAKIPNIYKKYKIKDASFGTMALIAVFNTCKKGTLKQYMYKHIKAETVSGTFNEEIEELLPKVFKTLQPGSILANNYIPKPLQAYISNLENLIRYFLQAAYQHTTAYDKLLKIEAFMEQYYNVKKTVKAEEIENFETTDQKVLMLAGDALGINLNDLSNVN